MTPLLELRGVRSGYGGASILHDVDLTVDRGEIVALLGANGSGKTTTMLTIGGDLPVSQGELAFEGRQLAGPPHRRARRGISLIAEDRSLFMRLTVADNLRLGRGAVDAALDAFPELSPLMGRAAGSLSGGEQQILAVARALAAGPKLLMIDELSLGLAPLVVDRLLESLQAVAGSGTGVLLVEQHARKALTIADRGYVLRRGTVVVQGSCRRLLDDFHEIERSYLHGGAEPDVLSNHR
jgi:branched-chain amino acid transport system ATP-binding protein